MSRSRSAPLLAAIAVVLAAVGVVVLGRSASPAPTRPRRAALAARLSIPRPPRSFGDTFVARLWITLDPRRVDPASVRLGGSFSPLTLISRARARTLSGGGATVTEDSLSLACLNFACLPGRPVQARPLRVVARLHGGRAIEATAAWPALNLAGRVSARALNAASIQLRAPLQPPPVSYRVPPTLLADGLDAAALVLLLAATVAVASALLRGAHRRHRDPTVLEQALALVRESARRGARERRLAVGNLARVLAHRDSGLAPGAAELAWSEDAPTPAGIEALARDVQRAAPR